MGNPSLSKTSSNKGKYIADRPSMVPRRFVP